MHIKKLPRKSPSERGKPKEFLKVQSDSRDPGFHFNRPFSCASTIPTTLHHPVFGKFIDDCETHVPTRDDNALALDLSYAMSQIYDNELLRANEFRRILTKYKIRTTVTTIDSSFKTDGDMQYDNSRFLIIEVKAEIAAAGAEPLFQAICYYLESTRQKMERSTGSSLPCLLIYLFGLSVNPGTCDSC